MPVRSTTRRPTVKPASNARPVDQRAYALHLLQSHPDVDRLQDRFPDIDDRLRAILFDHWDDRHRLADQAATALILHLILTLALSLFANFALLHAISS